MTAAAAAHANDRETRIDSSESGVYLTHPPPQILHNSRASTRADAVVSVPATRWLRIDAGAGYRFIAGSGSLNDRFSGASGTLSVQFGGG